jgi:RNA polymerase sigma factor (sigma-70 family)
VTDPAVPPPSAADRVRVTLLYHFCRVQLPQIPLPRDRFDAHLARTLALYVPKSETPVTWGSYLDGLYALDWTVCVGCLDGRDAAWELLFAARTGRSDCLLVDALRARAVRLYPRDEERQETSVTEFWSNLIAPETDGGLPVLARYDGQRPLAPWLIRVFQNWHLSKLRQQAGVVALPDDDIALPLPSPPKEESRWHEAFIAAANDWLADVSDGELLILGLRWRYRMSQREVAHLLGVHEGTISRQTDKLRDRAVERIGGRLTADGWTGDDLERFVLTELGAVLTDDPRLTAEQLAKLLAARGKSVPAGVAFDGPRGST